MAIDLSTPVTYVEVENPELYTQYWSFELKKFVLRELKTGIPVSLKIAPQPHPFKDVPREIPGMPYDQFLKRSNLTQG